MITLGMVGVPSLEGTDVSSMTIAAWQDDNENEGIKFKGRGRESKEGGREGGREGERGKKKEGRKEGRNVEGMKRGRNEKE